MNSQYRHDPLLVPHLSIRLEFDQHILVVFHCPRPAVLIAINFDQFLDASIGQRKIGLQPVNGDCPPGIFTAQLPTIKGVPGQRSLCDSCTQKKKSQEGCQRVESQSPNKRSRPLAAGV